MSSQTDWLTNAQTAGQTLVLTPGTYPAPADLTLAATVVFEPGAVVVPAAGVTVTITGQVVAGQWQIFDCSAGSVVFAAVALNGNPVPAPEVWVDWFGALPDKSADASAAVNAAIAALPTAAGGAPASSTLVFGRGEYLVAAPLSEITGNVSVMVRGAGVTMTSIYFDTPGPPASPPVEGGSVLFCFDSGSPTVLLDMCGVTDLSILCDNAADTRTAIYCGQVHNFTIRNVQVYFEYGDPYSIGLRLLGRDESTVSDVYLYAGRPIVVSLYPGTETSDDSGLDHWCFTNMVIYNTPPSNGIPLHPLVEVEDGCALTNVVFTGKQVWVGGSGAFSWDGGTTNPGRESGELVFENVRWEGDVPLTTQPAAFLITPTSLAANQQITFKNVFCGVYPTNTSPPLTYQTGFYLRNVREVTFNSVTVEGAGGAVSDIDDSCDSILLLNFGTNDAGPPNIGGGLTKVFSAGLPSGSGLGGTEQIQYYSNVSSGNAPNLSFLGQYVYAQSGTLPANTPLSIALPAFSIAQLFLAYTGPGGTGGGQVLLAGNTAVVLSGSGVSTSPGSAGVSVSVASNGSGSTITVQNDYTDNVTLSGIVYYVPTAPVN
jgi:hypothetical protein